MHRTGSYEEERNRNVAENNRLLAKLFGADTILLGESVIEGVLGSSTARQKKTRKEKSVPSEVNRQRRLSCRLAGRTPVSMAESGDDSSGSDYSTDDDYSGYDASQMPEKVNCTLYLTLCKLGFRWILFAILATLNV